MATQVITSATKLSLMKYTPFEIYKNSVKGPWVIICDHASNYVPKSVADGELGICLLYTSPSPRDKRQSRMPSSA